MKKLGVFVTTALVCGGGGFFLALLTTVAPSYARATMALDLNITLSKKAEEKLGSTGEGITVLASFFGTPKSGAEKHANDIGMIDLGSDTIEMKGLPGPVHITTEHVSGERLGWIEGPVNVNVNLFSSRKSSEDNVLNCDFVDGQVELAAKAPITLHCSLIEEGIEVNAYP